MTAAPPPQANRIGNLDLPATRLQFTTECRSLAADQWIASAAANFSLVARPAINALLGAGVHPPQLKLTADTGHMHAIFRPVVWRIDANIRLYEHPVRDAVWMRNAAAYVYHEARHAEQVFLIARLLAGKTAAGTALTENERAIQAMVPQSTLRAADRTPLQPTQAERDEIGRWVDGYVGSRRVQESIDAASKQVELTGEMIANEESLLPADFTSERECDDYLAWVEEVRARAALAEEAYRRAVADYVAIPMEQDAYAIAARVGGAAAPDPAARARAWRADKIDGQFAAFMRTVHEKAADFRRRAPAQPPPPAPVPAQQQVLVPAVEVEQPDDDDLFFIE